MSENKPLIPQEKVEKVLSKLGASSVHEYQEGIKYSLKGLSPDKVRSKLDSELDRVGDDRLAQGIIVNAFRNR